MKLFNTPDATIKLSSFDNLLHGSIVTKFEQQFAEYVGADYACSCHSASIAIKILLELYGQGQDITIPTMAPPVITNAICLTWTRSGINFNDKTEWIGDSYILHSNIDRSIIDSAQKVEEHQYATESNGDTDIIIYSFYPTKPIGSIDGGMIVSNDKDTIDTFRLYTMNGATTSINSWERKQIYFGYKAYMNSVQAKVAQKSFLQYPVSQKKLKELRDYYNSELLYNNTSNHLYRIEVEDNKIGQDMLQHFGIPSGIHYKCQHQSEFIIEQFKTNNIFKKICSSNFPKSEALAKRTLSIPFHSELTQEDAELVVKAVKEIWQTQLV